jgi:hypothetical protein
MRKQIGGGKAALLAIGGPKIFRQTMKFLARG